MQDNITKQPLSNATVRVYSDTYNKTKLTGVGFVRQTDWSGGIGQENFIDETKYWSDDGKIETSDPDGDLKLLKLGENYVTDGVLESSTFDFGQAVNFVDLNWEPFAQPEGTGSDSVRFQIATSNTSTPAGWEYLGPDGTVNTYYNSENITIAEINNGNQYLRYKLYLSTDTSADTPTVSDINISYTTSCTPPGQAYFGGLSEGNYFVEISRDGYQTKNESVYSIGDIVFGVDLVSL